MTNEGHPVEVSTRVCSVSNSGFYAWRDRPPSQRSIRRSWLTDQIIDIHIASRGTYGVRRVQRTNASQNCVGSTEGAHRSNVESLRVRSVHRPSSF